MGLDIFAKGLVDSEGREGSFCAISYWGYRLLMIAIARAAYGEYMGGLYAWAEYNPVCGAMYYKTPEDVEAWNLRCNDDLDVLLFHSDCDGKFTPKECKGIYNAIKNLRLENERLNAQDNERLNAYLEKFKAAFKHCAERRVNLYYG